MKRIGIYIGSHQRDIDRYEYLINSIRAFNKDNIPIYTCVNDDDIDLFKNKFKSYDITFYKDSDVYDVSNITNNWYKQQLIKMNFWKLNVCDIMIQIDSDSFFIKDFYVSDFMATDDIPYTVMHQNKELMEFFADNNKFNSKVDDIGNHYINHSIKTSCETIRQMFTSNIKTIWDYGHPPCIWDNRVWQKLDELLIANDLKHTNLLDWVNSEQQWYGETLIDSAVFNIYPIENMFKTFHYKEDYSDFIYDNTTKSYNFNKIDNIKYNFHGICVQSNWSNQVYKDVHDIELYDYFFTKNKIPKKYYGQFGEDKFILENFDLPTNGVIIDVGADQPVFGSNSYIFEKYLGWNCVCIDADERTIEKLSKERGDVELALISNDTKELTFHLDSAAGISKVINYNSDSSKTMKSVTLNSILEKRGYDHIDILDIDVEGHELNVCDGLDWDKYAPSIVIIEFLSPTGNIKTDLISYFKKMPYTLITQTYSNLIFCRNDYIRYYKGFKNGI